MVLPNGARQVRSNTILLTFVAVIIFLWSDGFDLQIFNLSDRFKLLSLAGIFLVVFAAVFSIFFSRRSGCFKNYYFRIILAMLFLIFVPTFVNLVIVNNLNIIEILRSGLQYGGILIFVVLISYPTHSSFINKLNNLIVTIATINVVGLVVLSTMPALSDILITKVSGRFEWIRLSLSSGMTPIAQYSIFYMLVMYTNGLIPTVKRYFYLLLTCTYLWYFFTIGLGRRTTIALLIVLGYHFISHLSSRGKVRVFLAAVLLILLSLAFPQSTKVVDAIGSTYDSIIEDFKYGRGTVNVRLAGSEYYLDLFRETNYIGIGLFSSKLPSSDPYFKGRVLNDYNPGDHGIVAVLYSFGFQAMILTVVLLIHIFRDLAFIRRRGPPEYQEVAAAMHLFLVFSVVGMLQVFWKPSLSIWTGIMFFMVWRMRKQIREPVKLVLNQQRLYGKTAPIT
ncbi:MAG: hypothetical protein NUV80_05410 [Candidatus Berkelbacteria bacterium]|nr:hypothetical protein [Candidatus Berkelbacteria bacterium]